MSIKKTNAIHPAQKPGKPVVVQDRAKILEELASINAEQALYRAKLAALSQRQTNILKQIAPLAAEPCSNCGYLACVCNS